MTGILRRGEGRSQALTFAWVHKSLYRAESDNEIRAKQREGGGRKTMTDSATPQTPQELIERIERSWQGWVDAVEGIPDERLAEPTVGHWSTKDLLGHVAFWEDWVIDDCQRILAGKPDPADDLDPVNEGQVAERQGATGTEQKRYRDEAHARLAAFLGTLDGGVPTFPEVVKALEWETWAHYDEHAAQTRAWRAAEGI
jgi:hypothetical protein